MAGHHVLSAADGVSGLRLARTVCADVVLLDAMLPGMDGIQVCRRFRRSSTTPIIMMTALEGEPAAAAMLDAGADAWPTASDSPRRASSNRTAGS